MHKRTGLHGSASKKGGKKFTRLHNAEERKVQEFGTDMFSIATNVYYSVGKPLAPFPSFLILGETIKLRRSFL